MTTQNLSLFQGMTAKMGFLHQRQALIAQNIANADTPGYKPRDVSGADFSSVLEAVQRGHDNKAAGRVTMASTSAGHVGTGNKLNLDSKVQRDTYEVSLTGNAVVMEEQLIKSQETSMDLGMMASLYQKNLSMLKMSIGQR